MIDLMLQAAREKAFSLDLVFLHIRVKRPHPAVHGPLHHADLPRHREASLFADLLSVLFHDDRINKRNRVIATIYDNDPAQNPDLGRRKPNAIGRVHRVEHISDELFQPGRENLHFLRLLAEYLVAQLPYLP